MPEIATISGRSKYQEDISTLAAGTEVIGEPCTVREITVTSDTAGVAVLNISDSSSSYDSTSRVIKVVINGQGTQQLTFPKGKFFSSGLCAVSNKSSINVAVSYD